MDCFCSFVFNQKTAYEMRISDCSADVCSSDLPGSKKACWIFARKFWQYRQRGRPYHSRCPLNRHTRRRQGNHGNNHGNSVTSRKRARSARQAATFAAIASDPPQPGRSEEHTSELQSLMRISYAVFCLKKKKPPLIKLPHPIFSPKRNTPNKIYI